MEPDQEKLDSIQEGYGFEEHEAKAYWHLQQARLIILELLQADRDRMLLMEERKGTTPGSETQRLIIDIASFHERVEIHFRSLNRELGSRVLRRNYPEGWGLIEGETSETPEDFS